MSEQVQPPVSVVAVNKASFSTKLATWLTILIALAAIVLVVLPSFGIHIVVGSLEQPAPTVRTLPTVAPDPIAPRPQPAQAVPTPVVAPTPFPVGQPASAAEVQPAAPIEAPAPVPVVDAPATLNTRAPVCFMGWWYASGQRTDVSCSGTGGD